jgi:RNA-directed DNA polymerase
LLANVYLNGLDHAWELRYGRHGKLSRYADDLVILTWRRDQAERAKRFLEQHLATLKLELSLAKTRLVNLDEQKTGFDFLGYHYRWVPVNQNRQRFTIACWPSQRAMQAARQRIRELTPLQRVGLPISVVVQDINRFLLSWGAYFRYGNSTKQFKSLDNYVQARLCRFIARKYGTRDVNRGLAVLVESKTRLGLWRLAGTVVYESANAGGERSRRAV